MSVVEASPVACSRSSPSGQAKAHWTASEAITWLAFGVVEDADWIRARSLDTGRRWLLVSELSKILEWLEQSIRFGIESLEADKADFVRQRQTKIQEATGEDYSLSDLIELLNKDISDWNLMDQAETILIEACRGGRVRCWGDRIGAPEKACGLVPPVDWLRGMAIRDDVMSPVGADEVRDWDRIVSKTQELFTNLTFASAEILALQCASGCPGSASRLSPPSQSAPKADHRKPTGAEFDDAIADVFNYAANERMAPPCKKALSQAVRRRLRRKGIWTAEKVVAQMVNNPSITERIGKRGIRINGRLKPFYDRFIEETTGST